MKPARRGTWVVVLCCLAALLLTVLPLPDWLDPLRPSFPFLVVIYWSSALPERYGTWSGWLFGLVFDVLRGMPLGLWALALALAGFGGSRLSARLKVLTPVQQAAIVGLLTGTCVMVLRFVGNLTGTTTAGWITTLLPVITTALVWPWAQAVQERLRRSFNVN